MNGICFRVEVSGGSWLSLGEFGYRGIDIVGETEACIPVPGFMAITCGPVVSPWHSGIAYAELGNFELVPDFTSTVGGV
jgi:hypothetical protein